MGENSAIKWTDHTFNPWWGCARVSPGCQHCYAETFAKRTGHDVWGANAERRMLSEANWAKPYKWNAAAVAAGAPALVFCASMADVFEDRPELNEPRARLLRMIEETPALRWQLLTKRPENVRRMVPVRWLLPSPDHAESVPGWPANCWIGTTVEDQQRAAERLPALLDIPAPVRFLSCEPLLGPLDLSPWLGIEWMEALRPPGALMSRRGEGGWGLDLFEFARRLEGGRPRIGWVIVGGESGPGFRPLDAEHAADVCEQVLAAEIPLFFKQWGGRTPEAGGDRIDPYRTGKGQQYRHARWLAGRDRCSVSRRGAARRGGRRFRPRRPPGTVDDRGPVMMNISPEWPLCTCGHHVLVHWHTDNGDTGCKPGCPCEGYESSSRPAEASAPGEHQIEGAAQHLGSTDYERYVEACESWSIVPAPWVTWWARYGADYRAQIEFTAPTPAPAPAPPVSLAADCGCGFGASCRHTRGGGS